MDMGLNQDITAEFLSVFIGLTAVEREKWEEPDLGSL